MVKTWFADELFPYLTEYYSGLEKRLSCNFLIDTPIYRPFVSIEEQNEWMGKSSDPAFEPYVMNVKDHSRYGKHIKDDFGGLLLNQSGWVDTAEMVKSYRAYLLEKNALEEHVFDVSRKKCLPATTGLRWAIV